MWWQNLRKFLSCSKSRGKEKAAKRIILTESCVAAIHESLSSNIFRQEEGVAYLLGRTDGSLTLAVTAICPKAETTAGSFHVSSASMATVVRTAAGFSLQVVGQVHTHPCAAFHSSGDNEGARIAYSGYISIVVPDYGERLPALDGSALYMFSAKEGFCTVKGEDLILVPERVT